MSRHCSCHLKPSICYHLSCQGCHDLCHYHKSHQKIYSQLLSQSIRSLYNTQINLQTTVNCCQLFHAQTIICSSQDVRSSVHRLFKPVIKKFDPRMNTYASCLTVSLFILLCIITVYHHIIIAVQCMQHITSSLYVSYHHHNHP